MGRDNLDALLAKQKYMFKKRKELAILLTRNKRLLKKFFNIVKASSTPFITCYYCIHKGHTSRNYVIRRYGVPNGKYR